MTLNCFRDSRLSPKYLWLNFYYCNEYSRHVHFKLDPKTKTETDPKIFNPN